MTLPFLPTPADTQAARAQLEQLRQQADQVPPHLAGLLDDLLTRLAAGQAVQVTPLDAEISTQQAAELLSVSRPYVVKLVEAGELPHRKIGPRRRLALAGVLSYRARLNAGRQEALRALGADLQDLGLD
jgi:excisionase family DNA binding protein